MTKSATTIHQTFKIKAKPEQVIQCLIDEKLHSKLIDDICVVNPDGTFSAYDGEIKGKTLEHIPNEKLVQHWWYDYPDWDENDPSTLTLTFKKYGDETEVIFDQVNLPAVYRDEFADGWKEYYWEPMKKMLEK